MALNINTITPAIEKAKNIATEQYVDSSIASIDVSSDINANNDVFAQKLGYASYSDMVNAANNGQTIINGGYLRTGLIQANAITAGQINTSGLIAENISASEISGKRITGAVITGAVIKASYLDLDGQLEVLTNYHISVAMYNAAPWLYTDAVYIPGNNEYRIPSMSVIYSEQISRPGSASNAGTTISIESPIIAYNNGNSGTNLKCVSLTPKFEFDMQGNTTIYSLFIDSGAGTVPFYFYIGNTLVIQANCWVNGTQGTMDIYGAVGTHTISYSYDLVGSNPIMSASINLSYGSISFTATIQYEGVNVASYAIYMNNGYVTTQYDASTIRMSSPNRLYMIDGQIFYSVKELRLPKIIVNNMV